jgi:tripartite-type tricarboxylate transporter receptor subunit TctC
METGNKRRRRFLSAACVASAGLGGICGLCVGTRRAVARPAYPSRPLTLIVPFTPGSSLGANARLSQPHLERVLGQSVEMQFDAGGGGMTGHLLGAAAASDGYTMTMVSSPLATQPWLTRASVAVPDTFAFVGQVTSLPSVLLVRADSHYKTLADLVAALRAAPELLTTGTLTGWWSAALAQALFIQRAAIKPQVVTSYYSGSELVMAVSQGQLDFAVVGLGDVGPSLDDRRLRALAVTARTQTLPAVPSFQEQGFDVALGWWRGLAVPGDTSDEVVGRLTAGLRDALDSASLRADFDRNGLSVDPLDGPAFRQLVLGEYQTTGALFTSLGINMRAAKPA